jgi:hypothetical protein
MQGVLQAEHDTVQATAASLLRLLLMGDAGLTRVEVLQEKGWAEPQMTGKTSFLQTTLLLVVRQCSACCVDSSCMTPLQFLLTPTGLPSPPPHCVVSQLPHLVSCTRRRSTTAPHTASTASSSACCRPLCGWAWSTTTVLQGPTCLVQDTASRRR